MEYKMYIRHGCIWNMHYEECTYRIWSIEYAVRGPGLCSSVENELHTWNMKYEVYKKYGNNGI